MPLDHERELIEITDGNIGGLHSLIEESKRAGYSFLQRTTEDWYSGANKFDRPGEKLWGLFIGKDLIGVGGLNIDPYKYKASHFIALPAHMPQLSEKLHDLLIRQS